MEKTLFVSDLDGTLLNGSAALSDFTTDTLNDLIGRGIFFTFATARTIYSAKPITQNLRINVPCILNNGASIYDMQTGKYVKNNYIPQATARRILAAFRNNAVCCFVFRFVGGRLATCYDTVTNEEMKGYVERRKKGTSQPFIECADLSEAIDDSVIYINATGSYENLLPVRNEILRIDGADCAFYKDTYTDSWFLETFSEKASKANGLNFLRERFGFTKIVSFGDNLNDLSMFAASDLKIAVGNAKPEVKEKADLIIGTNDGDGVASWIYSQLR